LFVAVSYRFKVETDETMLYVLLLQLVIKLKYAYLHIIVSKCIKKLYINACKKINIKKIKELFLKKELRKQFLLSFNFRARAITE